MNCKKCQSESLIMRPNAKNPSATELICAACGTWQKFIGKEEIRLFEIRHQKQVPAPTNADRIRSMSDEELAELLSQIAYARYTPWAEPFSRTFCDDCPVTTVKLEGYYHEMDLHECDFADGKCPYGSDIVYWLQQPAKEEHHEAD